MRISLGGGDLELWVVSFSTHHEAAQCFNDFRALAENQENHRTCA